MKHQCYGCCEPEPMDRVRDSSGKLGYGTLWVVNADGTAFVAFGCRTTTVRLSTLELVSKP